MGGAVEEKLSHVTYISYIPNHCSSTAILELNVREAHDKLLEFSESYQDQINLSHLWAHDPIQARDVNPELWHMLGRVLCPTDRRNDFRVIIDKLRPIVEAVSKGESYKLHSFGQTLHEKGVRTEEPAPTYRCGQTIVKACVA
jgi:hypothetical protein